MTNKLYSLVLGLAGLVGSGCTTTEYYPADLSAMLADGNISRSDARAFKITSETIRQRLDSLKDSEKQAYTAMLNDLEKVDKKYMGEVQIGIFPVVDCEILGSSESARNLNGTKWRNQVIKTNYNELANALGADKANDIFMKLRGYWESTGGSRSRLEAMYTLVSVDDIAKIFGGNTQMRRDLGADRTVGEFALVPVALYQDCAIGAIEQTGVVVTPEFVGSLAGLNALVKPDVEEPNTERRAQ